jgi:hypothetical protein
MLSKIVLFAAVVASASANCDNNCSGHGTCMTDDVCKCYDNWGNGLSHDSGDCSDRICPYELAWVDTPDRNGKHHKYAECAGRGICNRESGECQCFDSYEGKGCQRTTCPNDCSGHGTCEYIEDMSIPDVWAVYTKTESFAKTFEYNNWDEGKIRGCVCDATYGDVDCSKRMCPYANDVLDVRDDLIRSTRFQKQQLNFQASDFDLGFDGAAGSGSSLANNINSMAGLNGKTFALTFRSKLNETFTTIPIVFKANALPEFLNDIQLALLQLPNGVIDGITVAGKVRQAEGLGNVVTEGQNGVVTIEITFTGEGVQGPQYLIMVEDYECGDGCTPKIDGLDLQTRYGYTYYSNNTEQVLADYNSYECGRRGKCDYSSGLCSCFSGYAGCACQVLTTLQ